MTFRVGDVVYDGGGVAPDSFGRFLCEDNKYKQGKETWCNWGSYGSGVFFRERDEYTRSPCTLHLPKEFLNGF